VHSDKLLHRPDLLARRAQWRQQQRRVVFTNGCFDVLHRGHVEMLEQARRLGDLLVVGLNSDAGVRQLKGPGRPLVSEEDRAAVLCALQDVDAVTLFDTPSVLPLVRDLLPDVLVKGGDYRLEEVVGRDVVEQAGGCVRILNHLPGRSTTELERRLRG
jgi:rfaE bifunctional protein nucleotidyltransferase chain/domain